MSATLPVTGNTSSTQPENRAFYPALDGLRALAFVLVFCQHYFLKPWGRNGVELFFVLSGFLITGILFDTRDDAYRVWNFYLRRTLRIFPLYYGVLAALLLTWPIAHWQWSWGWLVWPAYLGNFARFLHPYATGSRLERLADFQPYGIHGVHHTRLYLGHFWTLCVEEQFYLLWPALVFSLRNRRVLLWICALSLPVCLLLRLLAAHWLPESMLRNDALLRLTPLRLDALLLGGALALALRGPHAAALLTLARRALPVALGLLLLACIAFSSRFGEALGRSDPWWAGTWGLTLVDLLSALLILTALQPDTALYRIFRLRPLRFLGRISYGAYVFHDIFNLELHRLGASLSPSHDRLATAALALPFTILLAWISFRVYESPFIRLKEKWTRRAATTLA